MPISRDLRSDAAAHLELQQQLTRPAPSTAWMRPATQRRRPRSRLVRLPLISVALVAACAAAVDLVHMLQVA